MPLESLSIRQFRVFENLTIERLGRVNLVVGSNNVGKSCLLEALWLYARRGDPAVVWEILEGRDEIRHPHALGAMVAERTHGIKHLFHNRRDVEEMTEPIHIGAIDDAEHALTVGVGWYAAQEGHNGARALEPLSPAEAVRVNHSTLRLRVQVGTQPVTSFLFSADLFRGVPSLVSDCIACSPLLSVCPRKEHMARLWDNLVGSEHESTVLEVLRTIIPDIATLSIPDHLEGRVRPGGHELQRIPYVKLNSSETTMPIRSLGRGVTRLFDVVLTLFNVQDGFLLIDDIESGLHEEAQVALWRLIFQVAHAANIQVFATARTWDCVEAFRQACKDEAFAEGMLVCLKRQPAGIAASLVEGDAMTEATRESLGVC